MVYQYLTSAELTEVKSNIDQALAIAPASPDAHLALALFYYWGYRDYVAGLSELERVSELQPSSSLAGITGLRSTAAAANGNAVLLNSSARGNRSAQFSDSHRDWLDLH